MKSNYNVVAIDDGYGDVKYINKLSPRLIPSFVSMYKPMPENNFENYSNNNYIACEINNQKYLVGEYASRLDPNIKWVGGENKHNDKRFPILFKTSLALMTNKQEVEFDLLMLNLPIRYDTPERQRKLKSIALGNHQLKISRDGTLFENKDITIKNVEIKKQPFGSICDLILDNKGEIANLKLAKGFNVIVDIGARTLNIMTLDALEEQPELTTQTNDGMFSAYHQIGNYLEDKFNTIIPDGKLPQIIQDGEIKGLNITPVIDWAFENHANTIINILDKILITSWGFVTSIIFTGGGSEILKPYLEKHLSNLNLLFLNRYSNVKGLQKYGIRQLNRRRSRNINIRVGSYYGDKK